MTTRSFALLLFAAAALASACEGTSATESAPPGANPPPVGPPGIAPSVLTTLEVTPGTTSLDLGASVQLTIVARDQRGVPMAVVGGLSFTTSDPSVVAVSDHGRVIGIAAGSADIMVTKTVAGITRNASIKVTTRHVVPAANVVLIADAHLGWHPAVAHVKAGGAVQWLTYGAYSWSGEPHGLLYLFDRNGAAAGWLDLGTGSATHRFLTPGEYRYCSGACWDAQESGVVYVHP
ncbi:MAG: Ig-like domain-containing protein [Gemmatimonadota bacterium]